MILIVQRHLGVSIDKLYDQIFRDSILLLALFALAAALRRRDSWQLVLAEMRPRHYAIGCGMAFCVGFMDMAVRTVGVEQEMVPVGKDVYMLICLALKEIVYFFGIMWAAADIQRQRLQRESAEKSRYMEITREYYRSLKRHIWEVRKMRHDLRHHLDVLDVYLEQEQVEQAQAYVRQLVGIRQQQEVPLVEAGNEFANAVLSAECMKLPQDVTFRCEGRLPENVGIADYDLCTILGNLLSNAREACERLTRPGKEILLQIIVNQEHLIIRIENPIEQEVDLRALGTATSKPDKGEHGLGISSVREAVARNRGEISFAQEGGIFRVNLIFNRSF